MPHPTPSLSLSAAPRGAAYGASAIGTRAVGTRAIGTPAYGAPARPPTAASAVVEAPRPGDGTAGGPHPPALLDALLDALRSERKLVDDLAATMRRQRTAVAGDDLETVDDTVFATHRILATLGQARLRRRQLNRRLAGRDELPMQELEAAVGPQMGDPLRGARDGLQASARALAHEVDVNRRLLRHALATGDAQVRTLAGVPAGVPADGDAAASAGQPIGHVGHAGYAGGARAAAPRPGGGLLVDRTA